jgi:hypothetical protein
VSHRGGITEVVDRDDLTSAPSACCARKKFRPMRPKPLMPTRTAIVSSLSSKMVFAKRV